MLAQFISNGTTIIEGIGEWLVSAFNSVVGVLWTAPSGSDTTGSFTIVGLFVLISAIGSLVFFALNKIFGLSINAA